MASLPSAFTHRDPLDALPLPAVSNPPERNEDVIPVFLGSACRAWKSSQKLLSDEGNLVGTPRENQDNGRRRGTHGQESQIGCQTSAPINPTIAFAPNTPCGIWPHPGEIGGSRKRSF
jgi:hypothetical protein